MVDETNNSQDPSTPDGRVPPKDQAENGDGRSPEAANADDGGKWTAGATIRIALPRLLLNPISVVGVLLAVASAAMIVVFVAIDIGSGGSNPYLSIFFFLFLPALVVLGMILVPAGALLARRGLRRRVARTGEAPPEMLPVLNLNNRSHLRAIVLLVVGGAVALVVLSTAGVKGFEFGESAQFCGLTCHRVMIPEYTAYSSSTHARVPCVECHIGPGTSWFVKSKITGISQLVNYSLNTYERPIPVPVESLRPSRDTCEQCHWPERIYGDRLQLLKTYGSDQQNSLSEKTIVFRVGGGSEGAGVHWHVSNEVWYLPLDRERQQIGWVEVIRQDGSKQTFLDPVAGPSLTSDQITAGKRLMDCIDCHNRIAHEFRSFESEVDRAFTEGKLDQSIPFLKAQSLALGPKDPAHPLAEDPGTVKARLASLPDVYQRQYPTVYASRRGDLVAASQALATIYDSVAFAGMSVDSATYPQNVSHQGCDRCHGKLAEVVKGKPTEAISTRCDLCHYAPVTTTESASAQPSPAAPSQAATAPTIPHAVNLAQGGAQGECLSCHGRGSPNPVPVSHAGRTDSMCLLCHQSPAS